jgi:hypothetical protein
MLIINYLQTYCPWRSPHGREAIRKRTPYCRAAACRLAASQMGDVPSIIMARLQRVIFRLPGSLAGHHATHDSLLRQLLPHRPPCQPPRRPPLLPRHHHGSSVAYTRLLRFVSCQSIQSCQPGLDRPHDRICQMVCNHPAWIHEGPTGSALVSIGVLWGFDHRPLHHLGLCQGEAQHAL